MIVLRIRRTATTPLLSSPFTSSQPIHPPPPSLTLPVAKISLGFNGAGSLTFTRRRTNHQPRTANSYMAGVGSSVVNPTYAEIIVVRHGETDWNADGRIQGHLDVELNDTGRQQAATVADRLSREPSISVVYSSDLKRALETAQIIAAGCGAQEVIKEPDLWERHLGDLQGLVLREAAKLSPKAYQAFLNQRTDQEIPVSRISLRFVRYKFVAKFYWDHLCFSTSSLDLFVNFNFLELIERENLPMQETRIGTHLTLLSLALLDY
ncbi:hypothetical protein CIPAW_01G022000 [Carya illinoinensis]|uniref:Phosphoglycerate mutase n=1 Tax=Carya illinoinensis TaxID=32201 RepID=A0A8T1RH48_CARIL|nr:hypothetical protein CIPAW_01G022000 [Carya illinoinensis]